MSAGNRAFTNGPEPMPRLVIIRPVNGLANRLRAIACSVALAEDLGARVIVDWRAQEGVPALDRPLFGSRFEEASLVNDDAVQRIPDEVPIGVDLRPGSRVLTLRGHRHGEQVYMQRFADLLSQHSPEVILIQSGGLFGLGISPWAHDSVGLRTRRHSAYRRIGIDTNIRQRVASRVPFDSERVLGVHLRYGDRSRHASPLSRLGAAVSQQLVRGGPPSRAVLVCGDDSARLAEWIQSDEMSKVDVYRLSEAEESGDPHSLVDAMRDLYGLAQCYAVVGFRGSTFSEEASVMGGTYEESVRLPPPWLSRAGMGVARVPSNVRFLSQLLVEWSRPRA